MIELTYLGTLGTLSIMILFYILARLSERLGSVQKMSPLYRYYYLALLLIALAYVTHVLVARASFSTDQTLFWVTSAWFIFFAYHLPLIIAVSIGLFVTWRYWSWLITERI